MGLYQNSEDHGGKRGSGIKEKSEKIASMLTPQRNQDRGRKMENKKGYSFFSKESALMSLTLQEFQTSGAEWGV